MTTSTALLLLVPSVVALMGALTVYLTAKVNAIGTKVDGRMDEMLQLTKTVAHAAGVAEGQTGVSTPKETP